MTQRWWKETDPCQEPVDSVGPGVWWEQAPDRSRPRVLYIGDSISCGIRQAATKCSGEKLLFDGFGTSKAVDNSYFKD